MFKPGDKVVSDTREVELDAGKHWRAKLGFVLMSTDLASESGFLAMVPEGVAVHITRLKTDRLRDQRDLDPPAARNGGSGVTHTARCPTGRHQL